MPRPARRGAEATTSQITYSCSFEADMNGMLYFLNQVENNQRFMAVQSIKWNAGGLSIDEESLTILPDLHSVEVDIITYIYSDGGQG